jgi:hypothetical protein
MKQRRSRLTRRIVPKRLGQMLVAWIVFVSTMIAFLTAGHAQSDPATPFEIYVPEGASILRVPAPFEPMWCNSKIVAFPNSRDGRFWTEYYELGQSTPRIENHVPGTGNLLACGSGGAEQLRISGYQEGYESFGNVDLIATGYETTRLIDQAGLLSADRQFRTFIFSKEKISWKDAEPGAVELIRLTPALRGTRKILRVSRAQIESGRGPVLTAKVNADSQTIAYVVSTASDRTRRADPVSIELFVAPTEQRPGIRMALSDLLAHASRFDDIFFDHDKLVVTGATDDDKIVVATCEIEASTPRNCNSVTSRLNAAQFYVVALGQSGAVIGSRELPITDRSTWRACLFEASLAELREPPSTCQMHGPSLPLPSYSGWVPLFAVAPDNQHAAVRTKFRSRGAPGDPGTNTEWSIVPMSIFKVR